MADEYLEQLAELECPECGPLVDENGDTWVDDPSAVLGGDERGFVRCPDCGSELEPTFEASLGMLKLITEKHPELAGEVSKRIEDALGGLS